MTINTSDSIMQSIHDAHQMLVKLADHSSILADEEHCKASVHQSETEIETQQIGHIDINA